MDKNKTLIRTVPEILQMKNVSELWAALVELSCDRDNFYRGYNSPEFLKVSLNKPCNGNSTQNYIELESTLIKRFFNAKNSVGLSEINGFMQILKFGQHYGLPTRLLDWTLDPFISLYFALGSESKDTINLEISIIRKSELTSRGLLGVNTIPKRQNIISDIGSFRVSEIQDLCISELVDFNVENDVTPANICYYSTMFTRNLIESSEYYLIFYDVNTLNEREMIQKGLFSVCGNDVIHDVFPDRFISKKLRITIHNKDWRLLKDKLKTEKGYDNGTLFPNKGIQSMVEGILISI